MPKWDTVTDKRPAKIASASDDGTILVTLPSFRIRKLKVLTRNDTSPRRIISFSLSNDKSGGGRNFNFSQSKKQKYKEHHVEAELENELVEGEYKFLFITHNGVFTSDSLSATIIMEIFKQ